MYLGKKILGLIPARKNSKGIPGKNIVDLAGKPLIAWTIEAALESKWLDEVVVSTDCPQIQKIARQCGASVPFLRPPELALDDTPGIAPVIHACECLPGFATVVLLQPTSPLRTADDIDAAIELLDAKQADFCVGTVAPKHHPNWLFKSNLDGYLNPYESKALVAARQGLGQLFALNGAIYVANVEALKSQNTLFGEKTVPYLMESERSFDIDTPWDLKVCEFLIENERTHAPR